MENAGKDSNLVNKSSDFIKPFHLQNAERKEDPKLFHLLQDDVLNVQFQQLAKHDFVNLSLIENRTLSFFDLGPERDSSLIVIPVTVVYVFIFISGVIGNITTCIVIKKHRSMHTATNYYLFSLAISDFLLLLSGVPQEVYYIWFKHHYVFGEYFCIGRGLLAETSANATVATITAFTVERYMAICHPFLGQAMSKLNRAIRIIILIWLLSIVTAIPQAAQFGIINFNGIEKCSVVRVILEHSFQLSTFLFFFAPMSIIMVLYLLIGIRLYRSQTIDSNCHFDNDNTNQKAIILKRKIGSNNSKVSMTATQSDTVLYRLGSGGAQLSSVRGRMNQYGTRRVLKMLVAVVICFFICWAPFHAQRLIAVYAVSDTSGRKSDIASNQHEFLYTVTTYISGILYYLSTCINPLLYNLMSNKFRQAFKAILLRRRRNGSLTSTRPKDVQHLRRISTMTSTSQRDSSLPEMRTKRSLLPMELN